MHEDLVPPEDNGSPEDKEVPPYRMERDVVSGLSSLGHQVRKIGVRDELRPLRVAIVESRPHIVFNLLEEFHEQAVYDQNVVSFLELMRTPYTGCNPRGLLLARDKALSKKIVHYHRIRVPAFVVAPLGRRMHRPQRLGFPLIVKSLIEEASMGISQASVVSSEEKLAERVSFIHDKVGTDAIIEQYIDGRELYVGMLGNHRLTVLPIWELRMEGMPADSSRIATEKLKHDAKYQARHGITTGRAKGLSEELIKLVQSSSKRIYRALGLSGYARLDFRLSEDGKLYFLEANPNPQIARNEEFADAAQAAGISYGDMLGRIINLGLGRARSGPAASLSE